MSGKWKIIVSVGVLVIVVAVIVFTQVTKRTSQISNVIPSSGIITGTPSASEEELPAATGNIDDTVSAIVSEALTESSQIEKEMNDDVDTLGLDSQAINDFTQSYNENEF